MQTLHGTFDGVMRVTTPLAIHGELRRTVTIGDGGHLELRGVCGGDVIVEAGGIAELWGIIRGSVVNHGGRVTIGGIVDGNVEADAGEMCVVPTSIVRGRVRIPLSRHN